MIDTITRADSAMYAAKHGGGNQVVIWGDKA
jgi:PleD family two-component response regulator